MMKRIFAAAAMLVAVMLTGAALTAQEPARGAQDGRGRQPSAAPKNLQVLAKDIDLPDAMQKISRALGVNCQYCHVQDDMASDEKPAKMTARRMIALTRDINLRLSSELGKAPAEVTKVHCSTCHRGAAIPNVQRPTSGL